MGHFVVECTELRLGRQFAIDQKIGDLEKIGLLGQLLDRLAARAQPAAGAGEARTLVLTDAECEQVAAISSSGVSLKMWSITARTDSVA